MAESRSIFITGCSSGFGNGAARALAGRGHTVFATMRGVDGKNAEAAGSLRGAANEEGWDLHVLELDVTDEGQVEAAVGQALETAGRLDVLVNNAGVGSFGVQEAYPVDQVRGLFDINVFGVLRLNRAVLPHMRERGRGHLIYLSSGLGRFVFPFVGPYAATKFAVEALAEVGHYELRREGIDTTIVQPGAFGTDFSANMIPPEEPEVGESYREAPRMMEEMGALFARRGEEGEFGDPQEVVDALVRLAESEPGDRPLRVPVQADAAAAVNQVSAEVQKGVLEWMQVE